VTAEPPEREPGPASQGNESPEGDTESAASAAESTDESTAESAPVEPDEPVEPEEPPVWRPPDVPQPEPWHPKAKDLDPSSDTGWETAAKHELRAVRPEDVAALVETDPEFAAAYARATADPVIPSSEPATNLTVLPQAPADTALLPSDRRWRRAGRRVKNGLEATARPFLMLSLFGLGMAIGWRTFVGMIPAPSTAPPAVTAAQAAGTTTDVPPQVQSLIAALQSDDQSKVQTVVPSEPYRYLAGEFANWGFKSIRGAEPLWTFAKGNDSVTEILIGGTTSDGSPITINLVVHLHNGAITEFR